MKVIFLDIDGVLQPYSSRARFEIDRIELRERLSNKLHTDYTIYDEYDVAACYCDWGTEAVNFIKKIIKNTNAKIVISSDWRNKELANKMKDFLKIWNLNEYWVGETNEYGKDEIDEAKKYVDSFKTDSIKYIDYRQVEIIDYLFRHKEITNFVAIDDRDLEMALKGHFVETNNLINYDQMVSCIEILNGKDWKRV